VKDEEVLVKRPSLHSRSPVHPNVRMRSQTLIWPSMSKHLYFFFSPHSLLLLTSRPQVFVAVAWVATMFGISMLPTVVMSIPTVPTVSPTVPVPALSPLTAQSCRWGHLQAQGNEMSEAHASHSSSSWPPSPPWPLPDVTSAYSRFSGAGSTVSTGSALKMVNAGSSSYWASR
jgi:hypothetical protein